MISGIVSLFFSIDNKLDLLVVLVLVTFFGGGICLLDLWDNYQKRKNKIHLTSALTREQDMLSVLVLLLIVILWVAMFAV